MAFNLGVILTILKDIETVDNFVQSFLQSLGGRGATVLNPITMQTIGRLADHSSALAVKAKAVDVTGLTNVVEPPYVFPPVGTKLSPAVNTMEYPTNANDQNYVNRYKQAAAQQTALNMTKVVKEDYLNTIFPNWLVNYNAGRDTTGGKPPIPPKGFMAVVILGEGGDFEFDIQQVDGTVCPIPKFAKIPSK